MELSDYQSRADGTDQRPGTGDDAVLFPAIGLASEIGSLLRHVKKRLRDGDAHELFAVEVGEELGDVLWYVANLATKLGLDLDDVAAGNLQKVRDRWPTQDAPGDWPLLDERFPEAERLPRHAAVTFVEERDGEKAIVRLFDEEGEQRGDQLTDNAYEDDGYRFHDVFHLTYAAMLGWSPISRYFFGVKRNSDATVREVEDGGRAGVIEEGIAAFVFDYARHERFLEGVKHIDFTLLSTIRRLVSRLEVRGRTAHDWEAAILRSFEVWRELREHGGGTVTLDLPARSISFAPATQ
jgi:NTP pyrophosphatase (non-canonical NTP hydrolase)